MYCYILDIWFMDFFFRIPRDKSEDSSLRKITDQSYKIQIPIIMIIIALILH